MWKTLSNTYFFALLNDYPRYCFLDLALLLHGWLCELVCGMSSPLRTFLMGAVSIINGRTRRITFLIAWSLSLFFFPKHLLTLCYVMWPYYNSMLYGHIFFFNFGLHKCKSKELTQSIYLFWVCGKSIYCRAS